MLSIQERMIQSLRDQIELLSNERDMLREESMKSKGDHKVASGSVDTLVKINNELTNQVNNLLMQKKFAIGEAKHFSSCLEKSMKECNGLKLEKMCLEMDLDTLGADMSSLVASLLSKGFTHAEIKKMARP